MIDATLYVMWCTTKNRVRRRLARLREPRYALGAIVGIAYMYFAVYGRARARRGGRMPPVSPNTVAGAWLALAPTLGGAALLLLAGVTAILPVSARLLEFSKSETEFLFSAPLSKRQLLIYRLLRSQAGILIGVVIFSLLYPAASWVGRLTSALALFVFLLTIRIFSVGMVLTQYRIRTAEVKDRFAARLPIIAVLGAVVIVFQPIVQRLVTPPRFELSELLERMQDAWSSGPAHWLLQPFVWLIQPLFPPSPGAFAWALPAALFVSVVLTAWVLSFSETFAQMSDGMADRRDAEPQAARSPRYRARSGAWTLASTGRPEAAFAWKSAQQMLRGVNRRVWIRVLILIVWLTVVVSSTGGTLGLSQVLGVISAMAAAIAVLMGPQVYRADLRQDLEHLDVLKTWPVRPGAVIRGEMLWPALVVTLVAWGLGAMAFTFSAAAFSRTLMSWRIAVAVTGFIMAPALIVGQYTVHATLALLFPAWIPSGNSAPRGIDAMGQRMILLGGTWLTLAIATLPAVIVGAILWFGLYRVIGPWFLVPAAVIGAMTLTVEALVASEALGPLYEKLDIAGVERPE